MNIFSRAKNAIIGMFGGRPTKRSEIPTVHERRNGNMRFKPPALTRQLRLNNTKSGFKKRRHRTLGTALICLFVVVAVFPFSLQHIITTEPSKPQHNARFCKYGSRPKDSSGFLKVLQVFGSHPHGCCLSTLVLHGA